jgi:hypothetical protein
MSRHNVTTAGDGAPDPESLAEVLLDAAAMGTFEPELDRVRAGIEDRQDALDPQEMFRYRLLFFDVAMVSTDDARVRHETALGLLNGAVQAGEPAWEAIRISSRLDDVERLASGGGSGIELLELLAYSPAAGMRAYAVSQIESAGLRALDAGGDSRTFERLLHAIGASADAYRLESARKQRMASNPGDDEGAGADPPAPDFRVIGIVGGHAQLRGTAARLLERHGVETVSIPSSLEAVRRERDIVHLLQGCDLAMLLVRQITHSTSDQVRKAAEKLGIPVIFSNALSAVAIERQLFERDR